MKKILKEIKELITETRSCKYEFRNNSYNTKNI